MKIITIVFGKINAIFGAAILLAFVSSPAAAERYWPERLSEWSVHLNNGVVYIASPQMAAHCAYNRGQIDVNQSAYNRALYAYVLSAKARGKMLRYVVDRNATECVIDALEEV